MVAGSWVPEGEYRTHKMGQLSSGVQNREWVKVVRYSKIYKLWSQRCVYTHVWFILYRRLDAYLYIIVLLVWQFCHSLQLPVMSLWVFNAGAFPWEWRKKDWIQCHSRKGRFWLVISPRDKLVHLRVLFISWSETRPWSPATRTCRVELHKVQIKNYIRNMILAHRFWFTGKIPFCWKKKILIVFSIRTKINIGKKITQWFFLFKYCESGVWKRPRYGNSAAILSHDVTRSDRRHRCPSAFIFCSVHIKYFCCFFFLFIQRNWKL